MKPFPLQGEIRRLQHMFSSNKISCAKWTNHSYNKYHVLQNSGKETATIQPFTNTLVVASHKINAYRHMLHASGVSVAPPLRDQLNAKDADVTSLPSKCW